MSRFEHMGGEPALREVVSRFVDRMFDDVMIGFLFRSASRERVKQKEYEFAARHLGAGVRYTGRALDEVHSAHPINVGHFNRRVTLLKGTLEELGVPAEVRDHWLTVTESLRSQIVASTGSEACPSPEVTAAPPSSASRESR